MSLDALRGAGARTGLFVAMLVAFFLTYKHTVYLPRPGERPEAVALAPVSDTVWHSAGWLVFVALLVLLFLPLASLRATPSDLVHRRLAIVTLGVTYAVTAWARVATGRTFGVSEGPLLVFTLVGLVVFAAVVRWPPPTSWLLGGFLVAGVALRLALFRLIDPDPAFSDNLPAIERSLGLLAAGTTPYAIHDFGTHSIPMPYLPLTFLSYLPAYALGVDIRVTNLVLSVALTLVSWWLLRVLPLPATTRSGLALLAGVLFLLPERASKDVYTEWQMLNLLLTLTFGLVMLGRLRAAAVAYGASLAAMPVAVFVATPLMILLFRARPLGEALGLAATAALVGGLPTLAFVLWDPNAFFGAFLYGTTDLWSSLAEGESTLPLLLWHHWLGGWLLAVQAALVLATAWLSLTRLRSVRGLIALAATLYVGLVITGPHIAQYMATVALYLALLEEAARAAGVTAGDRALERVATEHGRGDALPLRQNHHDHGSQGRSRGPDRS